MTPLGELEVVGARRAGSVGVGAQPAPARFRPRREQHCLADIDRRPMYSRRLVAATIAPKPSSPAASKPRFSVAPNLRAATDAPTVPA
jgi:hypothetical protein